MGAPWAQVASSDFPAPTGVASCAYPYYTPAARRWNQSLKIAVAR